MAAYWFHSERGHFRALLQCKGVLYFLEDLASWLCGHSSSSGSARPFTVSAHNPQGLLRLQWGVLVRESGDGDGEGIVGFSDARSMQHHYPEPQFGFQQDL